MIGRRRLDTHIHAFAELGVEVEINGAYDLRTERLVGTRMYLDEASVMGTENAIMAAVLAEGETVVGHAACEPHIQDLCRFLVALGAEIEGIGSNVLRIQGVERLGGGTYRIGPEHVEVASFAALAAVTGGDLTIEDVEPDDLISIVPAFRKLGIAFEVGETTLRVPPGQALGVVDDLGGQIPKIESGIWPAFPADLTSIAVVAATQATGTVLVFEKMFESRLFFVDKLVSMGARIILCDPHRAVVTGPARLFGQRLESPDIRAGMAMVIAALCAEGRSSIGNIRQIDRGYERIDERLRALGADIVREERERRPAHTGQRPGERRHRRAGARPPAHRARARRTVRPLARDRARRAGRRGRRGRRRDRTRPVPLLRAGAHGNGVMLSAEALAMVVVEATGTSLVASNADLTGAGGLRTDLAARFLGSLADAAALSLHVRLIEGENTDHVLEAIFKALGVALAEALDR